MQQMHQQHALFVGKALRAAGAGPTWLKDLWLVDCPRWALNPSLKHCVVTHPLRVGACVRSDGSKNRTELLLEAQLGCCSLLVFEEALVPHFQAS